MSAQTKEPARDTVTNLAAKIYMELVCRNVVVTESAAQIKSNPENLARISFKLAEAFQRIEADVKGGGAPKNQNFDVNDVDLSNWGGAKT
jgi:hypothetical protein